jgi:hypothetical protein
VERRRVDEGRGRAGASTGSAERFGERRYGVWGGTDKAVLGPDTPLGAFERRPGPNPSLRWPRRMRAMGAVDGDPYAGFG